MPRTKVSKLQRTRDAIVKEEKVRSFEKGVEELQSDLEAQAAESIADVQYLVEALKGSLSDSVLKMRFVDFQEMNLSQVRDYNSTHLLAGNSKRSPAEGRVAAESGKLAPSAAFDAVLSMTLRGRKPGPLTAALARPTSRRSRSARAPKSCQQLPGKKLRTPLAVRSKAVSADRGAKAKKPDPEPPSKPCALLRWPQPGEPVVSVRGTPLHAPMAPHRFASVSIPVKDGVLSLQPKKLESVDHDLVQSLDPETLDQIKTLQKNLELIVKMSDCAKAE